MLEKSFHDKAMIYVKALHDAYRALWEIEVSFENPATNNFYKAGAEVSRIRKNANAWGRKHGIEINMYGYTVIHPLNTLTSL